MRHRVMLVATGLVVAIAVAQGQQAPPGPSSETFDRTLIANERALQAAVAQKDKPAFVALVLPDGAWTTRRGFVEMNTMADGLAGLDTATFEIINPAVIRLSDDAALVLYVWSGTSTVQGKPSRTSTLASTAWTKRDGKWRAVHHQQTELVED
jgi:uncharacterized protein (TIGR02246 family)